MTFPLDFRDRIAKSSLNTIPLSATWKGLKRYLAMLMAYTLIVKYKTRTRLVYSLEAIKHPLGSNVYISMHAILGAIYAYALKYIYA